jgi:hypothetical protein
MAAISGATRRANQGHPARRAAGPAIRHAPGVLCITCKPRPAIVPHVPAVLLPRAATSRGLAGLNQTPPGGPGLPGIDFKKTVKVLLLLIIQPGFL